MPPIPRAPWLISLAAIAALAPRAFAQNFPALNSPASTEHHVGKFEWADLFADNADSEANFYTKLFGWSATTLEKRGHRQIELSSGSQPIASIVQRNSSKHKGEPARWIGFAAVQDLQSTVDAVQKNGGTIVAKIRRVPDRGEEAIATDRDGAVFGLIQSNSGDTPDYQPAPGELAWAELFSTEPKASVNFYQSIFRYTGVEDPGQQAQDHYFLADGEVARAGVAPSPPWSDGKSDWLVFFCVANVDQTAQQAKSLGGSVAVAPHESRHGGRVAVILDPEGAAIGLLEVETAQQLKDTP